MVLSLSTFRRIDVRVYSRINSILKQQMCVCIKMKTLKRPQFQFETSHLLSLFISPILIAKCYF